MTGTNPLGLPVLLWTNGSSTGPASIGTPHNIFRRPDPAAGETYSAGGLIPPSGHLNAAARRKIYLLMAKLRTLLWSKAPPGGLWQTPLPPPGGGDEGRPTAWAAFENPYMPAGYTYLLQFIAHDLVDTVRDVELAPGNVTRPTFRNVRGRALMLDTLYGAGPSEAPYAYATRTRTGAGGEVVVNAARSNPRTRLRIGDVQPPGSATLCPARDLARVCPEVPHQTTQRSDALIADVRNDAHPIVAQLTMLFAMAHNWTVRQLESGEPDPALEMVFRRFLCARAIVTNIYHDIIEQDLLARILHPYVLAAYRSRPGLMLDPQATDGAALEFSAGAFRVGHALVREHYVVNDLSSPHATPGAAVLSLEAGFAQTSHDAVRPDRRWAVDWVYFFRDGDDPSGGHPDLNLARRLGPFYAGPLVGLEEFRAKLAATRFEDARFDDGLSVRDFLTASYAGLWSAPSLIDETRSRLSAAGSPLAAFLPPVVAWRQALADWLVAMRGTQSGPVALTDEDIGKLAADPPLPFFFMFEAAHEIGADGRPLVSRPPQPTIPGAGGRWLGMVGSIVVAETMFAGLRRARHPAGEPAAGRSAAERICEAMGIDPGPLVRLWQMSDGSPRTITTMWQLIKFLEEQGFGKCLD